MEPVKITLNLPEELATRMREEAKRRNISMTEYMRRSLETELFLSKEEDKGSKILLEKDKGRMVQLVRR